MAETFEEYAARLGSLSAGKDPIAILSSTPSRIGALVAGRAPGDLRSSSSPDRWSVAQIVAHLADGEIVTGYRVRAILAAPGLTLQPYDQNAWARTMRDERLDPYAALALFAATRTSLVRLVRGLADDELDRYGMHPERGQESVRHILALTAGHDLNHLAQIESRLAERDPGAAASGAFTPAPVKPTASPEVLAALDVRTGTIRAVVPVAGADRLVALTVDFGDHTRSIVAGIRAERPSLDALVGAQALFVVNLPLKTIRGQRSEGMLFDVGFADGLHPSLVQAEWPVPNGVRAG
jgi:tRNA-binding protein